MCKSTKSVHLFKVHLFGTLGTLGVDVALLVGLADKAEAVHVTVKPTQNSFKEHAEGRVIKKLPVIFRHVQASALFCIFSEILTPYNFCKERTGKVFVLVLFLWADAPSLLSRTRKDMF